MPASDAYARVGNSVSDQRCSPAAARFIDASMIGLRAFCARACFFGSACDRARVLVSDISTIRTSDSSAAQRAIGETKSSWSSDGELVVRRERLVRRDRSTGLPPARRTSS